MAKALSAKSNFYSDRRGRPLAARPVGRDQLEGPLYAIAVYCLRYSHRPIPRISEDRLAELYLKQRLGLLSAPDPRFMRVRVRPFRAWLLRNVERIAMTKRELAEENRQRHLRLMRDYAIHGPHFHNPAHRAAWEAAQVP